jgi:hypothetical protein
VGGYGSGRQRSRVHSTTTDYLCLDVRSMNRHGVLRQGVLEPGRIAVVAGRSGDRVNPGALRLRPPGLAPPRERQSPPTEPRVLDRDSMDALPLRWEAPMVHLPCPGVWSASCNPLFGVILRLPPLLPACLSEPATISVITRNQARTSHPHETGRLRESPGTLSSYQKACAGQHTNG